jgi:hypothetical protein
LRAFLDSQRAIAVKQKRRALERADLRLMAPRPAFKSPAAPSETPPRMAHLAAVVVFCFAAGVSWPLLAGLELAPRPPQSAAEAQAARAAEAAATSDAPIADETTPEGDEAAAEIARSQTALVGEATVASCKTKRGLAQDHCDRPLLRDAVEPALRQLARCPGAQGLAGSFSLGLHVDFERRHIAELRAGRNTSLPREKLDELLSCAKTELSAVSFNGVAHERAQYWIYYPIELVPPGSRIEPRSATAGSEFVAANGYATVGGNSASVRAAPADDATSVARLALGTRVKVTGRQGDWYRVSYDAKGRLGWVHRGELGL